MRDDRTRMGRRRAVEMALAMGLALAPGPALADGFRGYAEVQYQRTEQNVLVSGPDGTFGQTRLVREFWTQTYELSHSARFQSGLSVFSQLRLNDVSFVKTDERTRTPYGTLRLAHPWFGLAGSYQPVTVTTALRATTLFPGTADSSAPQVATFRTEQSQLSGYLSAPRLPRVDLSWIRRHRGADALGAAQSGLSRNASASWGLGPLLLRGGYSDQGSGGTGFAPADVLQRAANGGAGLQLRPMAGMNLALDYDYNQIRHGPERGHRDFTRSQGGSLNGSYAPNRVATLTLSYGYRHDLLESGLRTLSTNHEGALLLTLQGRQGVRLVSGGGIRTSHIGVGSDVLRYATAVLSWDGRVRSGWQGGVSASHVTNWNPGKQAFGVEAGHATSRMHLRKGLDFLVDWLVTDTGDTTAQNLRWTTQSAVGIQASPLRSLTATVNARQYRSGPELFRSEAVSHSTTLDVRWRIGSSFETDASFGRTGILPYDAPRLATTAINARWNPIPLFQVTGTYTRSTQSRLGTQQLVGREVYGGRVLAAIGRSWNVNAGIYTADPGSPTTSRQVDASITRSFGR